MINVFFIINDVAIMLEKSFSFGMNNYVILSSIITQITHFIEKVSECFINVFTNHYCKEPCYNNFYFQN